jgi:hypothetical protein
MAKKSNRGKFLGKRRARSIDAHEQATPEDETPDPRSGIDDWLKWLELQAS